LATECLFLVRAFFRRSRVSLHGLQAHARQRGGQRTGHDLVAILQAGSNQHRVPPPQCYFHGPNFQFLPCVIHPHALFLTQAATRQDNRLGQGWTEDLNPDVLPEQEGRTGACTGHVLSLAEELQTEWVRDQDQHPGHTSVFCHITEQTLDPSRPQDGFSVSEIAHNTDSGTFCCSSIREALRW